MIRITTADQPARTVITVDGQVLSDYVNAVESYCNQALAKGKPVQLLLRNVSTIDESGRAMLSRFALRGIELKATGIYTSYVVETIRTAKEVTPPGRR